jgi:hypothetical protein
MPVIKVPTFDNIDDVRSKFNGTIVYYDGKPANVKTSGYQEGPDGNAILNKFRLSLAFMNSKSILVNLEDPLLNYKNYNLGYVNYKHNAVWWYRKPIKQYQQGLKNGQMGYISSDPYFMVEEQMNFSMPYIMMLSNQYPALETCEKILREQITKQAAFHKDFALSWDPIHEDFVLEYRGKKVGASLNSKLNEFKLMSDNRHLAEALSEALG